MSASLCAGQDYEVLRGLSDESNVLAMGVLENLEGRESFDVTLTVMNNAETTEQWGQKLAAQGLGALLPVVLEILGEVFPTDQEMVSHVTVRVDPDTARMNRSLNRQASLPWHNHPATARLFFYTIANDDALSTQVQVHGKKLKTPLLALVSIAGGTMHRTPPPRPGKRIHISVTLYKREKDEAVAGPSLLKRLRRSSVEVEETDPNLAHMG